MGQRNALCLGSEDVIVFRCPLQQLPGALHGQLLVAENYETGNIQLVGNGTDGQVAGQTCNIHLVIHKRALLFCFKLFY